MKIRKYHFQLDYYAWRGLVALPRMKFTGEVLLADKTWTRLDLVLYDMNEFCDYSDDRKSSIDKRVLSLVMKRLAHDVRYRNDYFVVPIRYNSLAADTVSMYDFRWPNHSKVNRLSAILQSGLWEKSFRTSQFACSEKRYWVADAFLLSALEFSLASVPVYVRISSMLEQAACPSKSLQPNILFGNFSDGQGVRELKKKAVLRKDEIQYEKRLLLRQSARKRSLEYQERCDQLLTTIDHKLSLKPELKSLRRLWTIGASFAALPLLCERDAKDLLPLRKKQKMLTDTD